MLSTSKRSKLIEALDAVRQEFETAVLREIERHPEWPYWRVGEQAGVSEATVLKIAQANDISRQSGPRPKNPATEERGL